MGALLGEVVSDDPGRQGAAGSKDISIFVEANVADRPTVVARAALQAAQADLSGETELAMLDVAVDGVGIEQVVDHGAGPVTAALPLERLLVTAAADGSLAVWRRVDGAQLGKAESAVPLAVLADADSSSLVLAALDREGRVVLVDLSRPAHPRIHPLDASLQPGETTLAVAFSRDQTEVVAIGSGGEVLRVDQVIGEVLERSSLREAKGDLPWSPGADGLDLVAAKFVPEVYDQDEGLLVATAEGDVAGVDLADGQGEAVLDAAAVPGRVLSIDRVGYGDVAVGASGGYVVLGEDSLEGKPTTERGPPVTGVVIGGEEDDLWLGGSDGAGGSGAAVRALSSGFHGVAAIHDGGKVSILGSPGVGISLDQAEDSAVATFDAEGRLLLASGYDANHVTEIRAVRPQVRQPGDEYLEGDVLETYVPDPAWWPDAEDPEALYLNDLIAGDEYVIAAGQDPEGSAAVMVWDAESAEPLQHLRLGTGGIETSLPSIITQVISLPGKDLIAAYSAVQELVGIWSTKSWELEDAVPVGAVSDLAVSPDEETLVAVEFGAKGGIDWEDEVRTLSYIDVDSASVRDEVRLDGAAEAAFSPDGETLAVAGDDANLHFRSADGRELVTPERHLGETVEDLAWRPDGALLAIALGGGGIALVDPQSGEVAGPLPQNTYDFSSRLSWSSDGERLLATTAEPEEGIEEYDPGPVDIWTPGGEALQDRMCELGGCETIAAEHEASEMPGDLADLDGVDLVFEREGDLFAADHEGAVSWLASGDGEYPEPEPAFDWSEEGFAWSSPGEVGVLTEGSDRPRTWPCPCSGIAWDGEEVVSVKQDGSALVRIDPQTDELRVVSLAGLPPYSATLLGVVAGVPIAAAFAREPDRSTFSRLYRLEPDGAAVELSGNARGYILTRSPSASPRTLAFVAATSSGVCYSTARVGVISAAPHGEIALAFPAPPLSEDVIVMRSAQVASDGEIGVTASRLGCSEDGLLEEAEPLLQRYLLADGQWRASGERGYDVQTADDGMAVIEPPAERGDLGALIYASDSTERDIAPEVESVVGRP